MKTDEIKARIAASAEEIVRLHRHVHETFKQRHATGDQSRKAWQEACDEFRARYDGLAFPGGYAGALERIVSGEAEAVEAAICFLELRPYFFRSGYMFKDILRKCKRAPLSETHAARLAVVIRKRAEWQASHPLPYPARFDPRQRLANRARLLK